MHSATTQLKVSNLNTDMAFGSSSKRKRADEKEDDDVQVVQEVPIDIQDGNADNSDEDGAAAVANGMRHPLLDEINIIGVPSGKNVGGTKECQCKHCKKSYKGSLTRVRVHLLGPLPGKKAQIACCMSLQNDPNKSKSLWEKVKEANSKGCHMRSTSGTSTPNPLAKSFGVAQRESVDMEITKLLIMH
jgi:hypothetical protein